mmetsp:Transcript_429/g.1306  ORF Transcript_429/g.1306 Transcript_429/m.1306 type:complete len:214 (-) Transcript_429:1053-1694(-)
MFRRSRNAGLIGVRSSPSAAKSRLLRCTWTYRCARADSLAVPRELHSHSDHALENPGPAPRPMFGGAHSPSSEPARPGKAPLGAGQRAPCNRRRGTDVAVQSRFPIALRRNRLDAVARLRYAGGNHRRRTAGPFRYEPLPWKGEQCRGSTPGAPQSRSSPQQRCRTKSHGTTRSCHYFADRAPSRWRRCPSRYCFECNCSVFVGPAFSTAEYL